MRQVPDWHFLQWWARAMPGATSIMTWPFYSDSFHLPFRILCQPCPAGFMMAETGAVECVRCPNHHDSKEGATRCLLCEEGYFYDNTSTDTYGEKGVCTKCPSKLGALGATNDSRSF